MASTPSSGSTALLTSVYAELMEDTMTHRMNKNNHLCSTSKMSNLHATKLLSVSDFNSRSVRTTRYLHLWIVSSPLINRAVVSVVGYKPSELRTKTESSCRWSMETRHKTMSKVKLLKLLNRSSNTSRIKIAQSVKHLNSKLRPCSNNNAEMKKKRARKPRWKMQLQDLLH